MTKCISSNSSFELWKAETTSSVAMVAISAVTDSGLLFMKEFDRKFSLTRRTDKLLDSFDIPQPGKHELRNDPLIQTVIGRDRQLATPITLCRFENGMNVPRCRARAHIGNFASGNQLQLDCIRPDLRAQSYFGDAEHRTINPIFNKPKVFMPIFYCTGQINVSMVYYTLCKRKNQNNEP